MARSYDSLAAPLRERLRSRFSDKPWSEQILGSPSVYSPVISRPFRHFVAVAPAGTVLSEAGSVQAATRSADSCARTWQRVGVSSSTAPSRGFTAVRRQVNQQNSSFGSLSGLAQVFMSASFCCKSGRRKGLSADDLGHLTDLDVDGPLQGLEKSMCIAGIAAVA